MSLHAKPHVECVCLAVTCHMEDHHCHSGDGQAEQDVEKQHQLPNQIRQSRPNAWGKFSTCRTENTRSLTVEPGQEPHGSPRTSPGNHQAVETGMVWPRHESWHPLQNHHARHRQGRMQTWEMTKELVRQHRGLDGDDLRVPKPPVNGHQQNSLEVDVCFFCPQVPPVTAKVKGLREWAWTDTKIRVGIEADPGEENSPTAPARNWTCDLLIMSPAF